MADLKPSSQFTISGVTKSLSDFASDLGCPVQTILGRLNRGWNIDQAISTPIGTNGGQNRGKTFPAEVLTPDELLAVLARCGNNLTGKRNQALIVIGWRAGLRIFEALALRLADLSFDNQTVVVLHGKGNKARTVGLDLGAWQSIQDWIDARRLGSIPDSAPLFCTEHGTLLSDRYVRELLPRLAKGAGIDKRMHYHGLRHTMAFELANEGVPMHLIQQQLGHSNLAITSRYINHLNPAETIARMKSRSWIPSANTTMQPAGASTVPPPEWLDRLRSELGHRLIAFTDVRKDSDDFRALITLI